MPRPMGRRAVGSLALVFSAGWATFGQPAETAAKIYSQAARSVLVILTRSADGQIVSQGSGFLVENGKIVTNEHAIRGGSALIDLGGARIPATVELTDEVNDLAVLKTTAEISAEPLTLADGAPVPGSAVFAIGNPLGLEKSISAGVVAGIRKAGTRELIQVTTPISPGSSGGPVLDSAGRVVGVTVGMLEDGQNVNFAVPASTVIALLAGKSATPTDPTSLVESAEALLMERGDRSDDPSAYERNSAQIRSMLSAAIAQATKNQTELLLRISSLYPLCISGDPADIDVCVAAAERATQLRPSPETSLALAKALWWRGGAEGDAKSGKSFLDRAEKTVRQAILRAKQPDAEMYRTLADILDVQDLHTAAETALRQALELNQKAPTQNAEQRAQILRRLIDVAEALKRPAEIDRWFSALVDTGKTSSFDWEAQAKRLNEANRFSEAGDAWQRAASKGPVWSDWCAAAASYLFASAQDATLDNARKCIAEGSGKPKSETDLRTAHWEVATVLNRRGVFEEALSHAKESAALSPDFSFAYDEQAVALVGLRRFQEAINAAKQAIRLSDGKYAFMHFNLGLAYFDAENWEFARQSFEKAAELAPKDDAAAYNLALCLQRLGYTLDAARWYEEVLKRNPTRTDRQELLNRIAALRR